MPRPPQREHEDTMTFAVTFAPRIDLLPEQRQAFARWLQELQLDGETESDLTLVFSELTANAVAGSPAGAPPVRADGWVEDEHLVIEVRNGTDVGDHPVQRWDLDDPLREGGRGLIIVRALVDELEVLQRGGELRVRCRRDAFGEDEATG